MRILYVSPFPPARDGIGTYSEMMTNALQGLGHDVGVIVPRASASPDDRVLGALTARRAGLVALRETALAWQPDCIHLQFAVAAFGTQTPALLTWLRLMRSSGIPVVVTMHEVTRDIGLLRTAGRLLYRALASHCDHVVVHTQSALTECLETVGIPAPKVSVIPHPTAPPPDEEVSGSELRGRFGLGDSQLLLAFGFVHVDKGLDDLVQALCILRGEDTAILGNVRLVIAGAVRRRNGLFRLFEFRDRIHLRRVLRMARRGGVQDKIIVTGYVPTAEIAGWFRAATAVTLPYRRTEQSGVAALANAFGIPVLASTVGGLSELYRDSGWTFPPRDPQEMARVITRFLELPDETRAISSSPRPSTDLAAVLEATANIYRSLARHAVAQEHG